MSPDDGPTTPSDRIASLDVLRGVAILGILLINVQAFSMPSIARTNPSQYGDFEGVNFAVWLLSHLFVEQKFITIFSLLFGAGVLLFTQRKGGAERSTLALHYRRTFWLLVIGLVHAYLLWDGDILVIYALCGAVIVATRHFPPSHLAVVGVGMMAFPFAVRMATVMQLESGAAIDFWTASEETIRTELEIYRGSWAEQFDERVASSFSVHTEQFLVYHFWRYGGTMVLGMALFKWGVLSNDRSLGEYYRILVGGFVGGLALSGAGVVYLVGNDWSATAGVVWPQFNYWGSVLLALAYVAAVMIYCQRRPGALVSRGLAAVGRTALSNYLFQTLVATTVFYGYGLGLFGHVSRVEQLGIVLAIWTVQVVLSVLWLRRYRYGPVEWAWRKLTYRTL